MRLATLVNAGPSPGGYPCPAFRRIATRRNVESARSRSPESVDLARRDHYKAMPILHFPPGDGIKRRRSEKCRCEPSADLAANGFTVLRRLLSSWRVP
jgi:hypothetical protein